MRKNSVNKSLVAMFAASVLSVNAIAQDTPNTGLSSKQIEENEELRRQQRKLDANLSANDATGEFNAGNYEAAIKAYESALKNYVFVSKTNPDVRAKIAHVKLQLAESKVRLAEKRVNEAIDQANVAMFDQALGFLDDAIELNSDRKREINERKIKVKALKKKFEYVIAVDKQGIEKSVKSRNRQAQSNLDKAMQFMSLKRYTEAIQALDDVLVDDPFNSDAARMKRRAEVKLQAAGIDRRTATRLDRMAEIEWKWSSRLRRSDDSSGASSVSTVGSKRAIETEASSIEQKLDGIIIPSVNFPNDTMADVVSQLKAFSKNHDVEGRGINIVLRARKTDNAGAGAGAAAPAEAGPVDPFAEAGGGAPADPFGDAEAPADEAAPAPAESTEGRVTLELENVPLRNIIEAVCLQQNYQFVVTKHAVIIAPAGEQIERMKTEIYRVPAGFLDLVTNTIETAGVVADPLAVAGPAVSEERLSIRSYFDAFGIEMGPGATVQFIANVSRLVVKNTPEQHTKIVRLINELRPMSNQVVIESKFVEFNETDIEELAFDWSIVRVNDGTSSTTLPGRAAESLFAGGENLVDALGGGIHLDRSGGPGAGLTTPSTDGDGLQSITRDLAQLLGSTAQIGKPAYINSGQAAIATVLDKYTFNTIIRAVRQRNNNDVLNAPKVTTTSGETAKIRVVEERYFPVDWEPPEVETIQTTGGGATTAITPTKPIFEEPKDIGIVLNVTPTIDEDANAIEMEINPQVVDFIGYDTTFNTFMFVSIPIETLNGAGDVDPNDPNRLAGNEGDGQGAGNIRVLYQMPVFESRTIQTIVRVWDNETVALGGLIKERTVSYKDKTPYLSDIPLIGRLFTSEGHSTEKQSLSIFVTARLIRPDGLPVMDDNVRGLPDFKRL